MKLLRIFFLLQVLLLAICVVPTESRLFLNVWAVRVKSGNILEAKQIAQNNGYELVEAVEGFPDVFIMKKIPSNSSTQSERRRRNSFEINGDNNKVTASQNRLDEDPAVLWAQQQQAVVRDKREFMLEGDREEDEVEINQKLKEVHFPRQDKPGVSPNPFSQFFRGMIGEGKTIGFGGSGQSIQEASKSNLLNRYNDELWPHQWYIHNGPAGQLARWDHGITKVKNLHCFCFVLIFFLVQSAGRWASLEVELSSAFSTMALNGDTVI